MRKRSRSAPSGKVSFCIAGPRHLEGRCSVAAVRSIPSLHHGTDGKIAQDPSGAEPPRRFLHEDGSDPAPLTANFSKFGRMAYNHSGVITLADD